MLKKRVIPLILLSDDNIVKGKQFNNHISTGNPRSAVKVYVSQHCDEIMFIDIKATINSKKALIKIIKETSVNCNVPFTVGGGIQDLNDIRELLLSGADKVLITSQAAKDIKLIAEAANKFGNQCIVAGIDYKSFDNKFEVYIENATIKTELDLFEYASLLEKNGAGEILLNSINNDGMMNGYDLKTIEKVSDLINVPLIACGGAGTFKDIEDLFIKTNASGAVCASIFNFGDNNPFRLRSYLKNAGINVRKVK